MDYEEIKRQVKKNIKKVLDRLKKNDIKVNERSDNGDRERVKPVDENPIVADNLNFMNKKMESSPIRYNDFYITSEDEYKEQQERIKRDKLGGENNNYIPMNQLYDLYDSYSHQFNKATCGKWKDIKTFPFKI